MPHGVDIEAMIAALNTREQVIEEQIKLQNPVGNPPSDDAAKISALAITLAKERSQLRIARLTRLRQDLTAVDQIATTLDKALQTPDEKTASTPLATIVKAEALIRELSSANTFSLLLKVVTAGGATRIQENLFTGSKLRHLGGAIFGEDLYGLQRNDSVHERVERVLGIFYTEKYLAAMLCKTWTKKYQGSNNSTLRIAKTKRFDGKNCFPKTTPRLI